MTQLFYTRVMLVDVGAWHWRLVPMTSCQWRPSKQQQPGSGCNTMSWPRLTPLGIRRMLIHYINHGQVVFFNGFLPISGRLIKFYYSALFFFSLYCFLLHVSFIPSIYLSFSLPIFRCSHNFLLPCSHCYIFTCRSLYVLTISVLFLYFAHLLATPVLSHFFCPDLLNPLHSCHPTQHSHLCSFQ